MHWPLTDIEWVMILLVLINYNLEQIRRELKK